MQFSTALIAALASGAIAAPHHYGNTDNGNKDTSVQVVLIPDGEVAISSPVTTLEGADKRVQAEPTMKGPFKGVNFLVGKDLPKELRCSVFDENPEGANEIGGKRGQNLDITFSDGGNGKWDFLRGAVNVSNIVCDPTFKKITPDELEAAKLTTVKLINEGTESTTPVSSFTGREREEREFDSEDLFAEVNIEVGPLAENQGLRCQLHDDRDVAIVAKRGKNVDETFSDAGKGRWTFINGDESPRDAQVTKVVCDPTFKSANA